MLDTFESDFSVPTQYILILYFVFPTYYSYKAETPKDIAPHLKRFYVASVNVQVSQPYVKIDVILNLRTCSINGSLKCIDVKMLFIELNLALAAYIRLLSYVSVLASSVICVSMYLNWCTDIWNVRTLNQLGNLENLR